MTSDDECSSFECVADQCTCGANPATAYTPRNPPLCFECQRPAFGDNTWHSTAMSYCRECSDRMGLNDDDEEFLEFVIAYEDTREYEERPEFERPTPGSYADDGSWPHTSRPEPS